MDQNRGTIFLGAGSFFKKIDRGRLSLKKIDRCRLYKKIDRGRLSKKKSTAVEFFYLDKRPRSNFFI